MNPQYTDDQIRDYAMQLQQKGASPSDIEAFVSGAKNQGTNQLENSDTPSGSEMINYPAGMTPNPSLKYSGYKDVFGRPSDALPDTSANDSNVRNWLTTKAPGAKLGDAVGVSMGGWFNMVKSLLKGNVKGAAQELKTTSDQVGARVPAAFGDTLRSMATAGSFAVSPTSAISAIGQGAALGGAQAGGGSLAAGSDAGTALKATGSGAVLGGGIAGLGYGLGSLIEKFGNKAIDVGLKPTQADYKDGYNVDTIKKFNIGGNLSQMYNKTDTALDDLSKQLRAKLENDPSASVNVEDAYKQTLDQLTNTSGKYKNFLQNNKITNALQTLRSEIDNLTGGSNPTGLEADAPDLAKSFISNATAQLKANGNTELASKIASIDPSKVTSYTGLAKVVKDTVGEDIANPDVSNWLKTSKMLFDNYIGPDTSSIAIPDAQLMKRAAQHLGAWQYGKVDPDSTALETVANTFSRVLKKQIEEASPDGVKEINQQIGDLIPVMNAIIRRIPVAERNSILSLPDMISLIGASFHPSVLGLTALNIASKSTRAGNFLAKSAGPAVQGTAPALGGLVGGPLGSASNTAQPTQ